MFQLVAGYQLEIVEKSTMVVGEFLCVDWCVLLTLDNISLALAFCKVNDILVLKIHRFISFDFIKSSSSESELGDLLNSSADNE